jgi:hypothetical protein
MAAAEPYLIAIILQLARMRNPINATTGLHLANFMIQGTEIAKTIIAKRAKRKKQAMRTIQDSALSLSTPTSTAHFSRTGSTALSNNANNSNQHSGAEKSAEGETTMLEGLSLVEQLNLSKGLSGSLINSILETRACDDARNGINLEENRLKRIESSLQAIAAKKKRYTAGLHVSAQRYMISPLVLDDMEGRERQKEVMLSGRQEQKLQEFRSLKSKVDALV